MTHQAPIPPSDGPGYPSGAWIGYWEQQRLGRQAMNPLHLVFEQTKIRGNGADLIGTFTLSGEVRGDASIRFVKKYDGGHAVVYHGEHDGEGTIQGIWVLEHDRGVFAIRPIAPPSLADWPIQEI